MRKPGADTGEDARAELAHLMRRVAGQDPASLKTLYDRTSAKLYGICLRLLQDRSEAQDILQDVYVTVWCKASLFDESKASAITWLAALARNRSIDRLRSRRPEGALLDEALEIPDTSPSSLDVLERDEDAVRLANCLEELEERSRNMIRSAFFDGATYSQLAERESVPLPTMKSLIRRGLARLRGCLER